MGCKRLRYHPELRICSICIGQVRRLGIKCALSARLAEGSLLIVDDYKVAEPKTKHMVEKLQSLFGEDYPTVLFIDSDPDQENFSLLKRAVSASDGRIIGGELNSSVLKRLIKGLTDRVHLRHVLDVRNKSRGESNLPVAKGLNKGLTSVLSPAKIWGEN